MRLGWLAVVSSAGCGVLSGLDGLSIGDGGGVDAGVDAPAIDDASLDVGSCESGACGAPAGFQPVLFASNRDTLCPAASSTVDAIIDPSAPPGACTCECNYQPSCLPQTFTYTGGNNACSTVVATTITLDGGCDMGPNQLAPAHIAVGPFAPTNACTNSPKATGTSSATQGRVCSLSDCTACAAPSGFQLCFAQPGDVACPQAMTKHAIGSSAKLACSSCTACSSTAKCKGSLGVYGDFSCGTGDSITVDGTCHGLTVSFLGSLQYVPSINPGACTPGTSTASISISGQTTVCCP